jgi:hypothetical protein
VLGRHVTGAFVCRARMGGILEVLPDGVEAAA